MTENEGSYLFGEYDGVGPVELPDVTAQLSLAICGWPYTERSRSFVVFDID
jgi:hypothetical protein